jgi:transposase-like protein
MASKTLTKSKLARLRETRWSEADAQLVLDEIEGSGSTIHAFAREHDLKAHRLYWWRARLAEGVREGPGDLEQLSFAPVVVTGLRQTPAMIVRLGELELELITPHEVDPAWLAQVIAATKGVR